MERALNLREAAERLNVHPETLKRWIVMGEGPKTFIKPSTKRPTYRIKVSDLETFMNRNSRGGR